MIEHADRPLLLVGAGANRKVTRRSLRMFIDKTGLPFVTTQMGKGFLCENDPLFLGNTALSSGDFAHRAVDAADLIINIGQDAVGKPSFLMVPNGVKVIHVNFSSAKVDPVYFPQLEVVGDIANAIWRISEGIQTQSHWDLHRFVEVKAAADAHLLQGADVSRFPIYPQRHVADVRKVMPDDGI